MDNELLMVCIYDRVAQEYSAPNCVKNKGVAYRQFRGEIEKLPPYMRDDYQLHLVGYFNPACGAVRDTPIEILEDCDNA